MTPSGVEFPEEPVVSIIIIIIHPDKGTSNSQIF
jgi:hypothetical protein